MPLIVKTLARTKYVVPELVEDMKIGDIKYLLASEYNISMDQIRLIYAGKQLEVDKTIEELGLYDKEKNVIISMVLSLRGGAKM